MIDAASFCHARLPGGFVIAEIAFTPAPFADALGRPAVAQTRISGKSFSILIQAGMDEEELSITLYHEVLEAATVAVNSPPPAVAEFNEGDFERAAHAMHRQLGPASPVTLSLMLKQSGFDE